MNDMQQSGSNVKAIRILYFAILSGALIFAGIIFFIASISNDPPVFREPQSEILLLALFVSFGCLVASGITWKKSLEKVREKDESAVKWQAYQSACIKRWALIEGAAFFVIICYYLTENTSFMIMLLILVIAYLMTYPSSSKISKDIGEENIV